MSSWTLILMHGGEGVFQYDSETQNMLYNWRKNPKKLNFAQKNNFLWFKTYLLHEVQYESEFIFVLFLSLFDCFFQV